MIAIANWQYVRFSNGDDDNTDDESVNQFLEVMLMSLLNVSQKQSGQSVCSGAGLVVAVSATTEQKMRLGWT